MEVERKPQKGNQSLERGLAPPKTLPLFTKSIHKMILYPVHLYSIHFHIILKESFRSRNVYLNFHIFAAAAKS